MVLSCNSLMATDVKHLCMCLFVVCITSSGISIQITRPIVYLVVFLLNFQSLHIYLSWIKVLYQYIIWKYFLLGLPLIFSPSVQHSINSMYHYNNRCSWSWSPIYLFFFFNGPHFWCWNWTLLFFCYYLISTLIFILDVEMRAEVTDLRSFFFSNSNRHLVL